MDTPTANILQIMKERISTLREEGNDKEALHSAGALIEKCQRALSTDLDTIDAFAGALETRAEIYLALGEVAESIEDAKQAIDQLDNRPDCCAQLGRLHALLGSAYDSQGRHERVIESWKKAVEYFEKNEPPLMLDVAAMTNNLGFTAKAGGDLDSAEDFFLRSLEIMHAEVGLKHEETAAVSNNLGAVYLAAGYLDQAREMHMIALETRRELLGEMHPDTAQSHNNLALALSQTGDRAWARKHFEKAFAAFEELGAYYADDFDSVSSNYCDFLRAEGEDEVADDLEKRVRERLQVV